MKTKSLLCLALVTSILLSVFMIGRVSAQLTTIGVEPDSIVDPSLGPGSTFTVEVWIRQVEDLAGFEFKLGYDTNVLTANWIEYGDIFGDTYFWLMNETHDAEGYLSYANMEGFGEPGFNGDGRAVIIHFTVDSWGESVLDLYDTQLGDSSEIPVPIDHVALDGYFSNVPRPVYVDIKPGSWPNPLKLRERGVLPVAVCGTEDFDAATIDPETIRLTLEGLGVGVAPLRWSYEDVATPYTGEPCSGHNLTGDGYLDLSLKFKAQEVIATLGLDAFSDRDVVILVLTGNLKAEHGGTLIQGQDCIVILDP